MLGDEKVWRRLPRDLQHRALNLLLALALALALSTFMGSRDVAVPFPKLFDLRHLPVLVDLHEREPAPELGGIDFLEPSDEGSRVLVRRCAVHIIDRVGNVSVPEEKLASRRTDAVLCLHFFK